MQKYNIILILQKKNVKILTPPILPRWCELAARTQFKIQNSQFTIQNAPRWCELAARTPIRQFHPKVIKKTFSFSGYSLSKVRSI